MEQEKTPRWKKLIIWLSLLPLLWWPVSIIHDSAYLWDGTKRLLMILFPFYALGSVLLAWHCRNERPEVMWILILLLWFSYAAIFAVAAL
ncbi:MAG: hypothetical protein IJG81_10625 [Muribaculaceae bacterium]|nr:hypothetical protein [Muribaculaceae bacterium]MBR0025017.1 hypothetical protein [Muribaculaceae bacterium]